MNINEFIFSRTQPQKKLSIISNLTNSDLQAVTKETMERIVKEAGSNLYKSRDKELRISRDRSAGNDWNSTLESVCLYKKKLYVNLYVQYGDCDTDTTKSVDYDRFFSRGKFEGEIKGVDYHFNTKYYYFTYDETDKARCMRSILLEYVHTKYAKKLKSVQTTKK